MQSLESAAFAAWPARETEVYEGWVLHFDRGYTKRANSANSSAQAKVLSGDDVDHIESRFRQRGLSPVFRLTSDASVTETDDLLIARGYRFADLSLVMTQPLVGAPEAAAVDFASDAASWLAAFQEVSGKAGPDQEAHLEILRRIASPCALALKSEAGMPVCCGLGVLVGDTLGLFDIATRASHRGQGLATELCRGLLAWGYRQGARTAFLQVVGHNAPAIGLYERLGFRRAYHYWYRVSG